MQGTNTRPEYLKDPKELLEIESQTLENPSRETLRPENLIPKLDPIIKVALAQLQANFSRELLILHQQIMEKDERIKDLEKALRENCTPVHSLTHREPKVPSSMKFTGNVANFETFMAQYSLHFELRPSFFPDD